ncbi:MAG: hypothetical protein AAFR58_23905 [Cyanobacteria bacterium J06627_28]
MLDNSNNNTFDTNASKGTAVWQSGWIEELWNQLENGTFNGVGNVVVDDDIAQSEQQILSDLDAIDRLLLGAKDLQETLSEVRDFAEQHRSYWHSHSGFDALTGTDFEAQAYQAANSLTEVVQYLHSQGLPDLTAEIGSLKFNDVALPGERIDLSVTLKNQGSVGTRHPVKAKMGYGPDPCKIQPYAESIVATGLQLPKNRASRKVLTNRHFWQTSSTYGLSHSLLKRSNPNTPHIFKN